MARLQPPDRLGTPGACPLAVGRSATEEVLNPALQGAAWPGSHWVLTQLPSMAMATFCFGMSWLFRTVPELGLDQSAVGSSRPLLCRSARKLKTWLNPGPPVSHLPVLVSYRLLVVPSSRTWKPGNDDASPSGVPV